MNIENISAVTLKVADMTVAVRFYRDVLGLEIIYGGEDMYFSSLCTKDGKDPILNLEQGRSVTGWGRLIFYVADVDAIWAYLQEKGFHPERPRDAPWGERYFHMPDPDGHELSFARPLRPPEPENRGSQGRQRTGVELHSSQIAPRRSRTWKRPSSGDCSR